MSDAPSWLQEGTAAAPAATPSPAAFEMSTETPAPPAANKSVLEANENDLPHMILVMRLANLGVAAAVMTCSVRSDGCNCNDWRHAFVSPYSATRRFF